MPLFVSFEGGEGSGKSTQARILHERLLQEGHAALLVREPGTTGLGLYLRDWLKRQKRPEDTLSPVAELFLFAAARAELVTKVIAPYIKSTPRGIVITDRYMDSTAAYQGHGRRIDLAKIDMVNSLATHGLVPGMTFLLDIPPEDGLARVRAKVGLEDAGAASKGRMDQDGTRRFEEESLAFHKRVRQGYLKLAKHNTARWYVLDATRPREALAKAIWAEVKKKLSGSPEMGGLSEGQAFRLGDA